MKILALTDIHGAYGKAVLTIERESPDVVIVGGDLTTAGTLHEAEEAIREFQSRCERVWCIAGNLDSPQHDELFVRMGISLNGRGVVLDNLVGLFGVSAAPLSRLHTPYEISEEDIMHLSEQGYSEVHSAEKKIFIPHAPPYNTDVDIISSGSHVGSTSVRNFIESKHPDIVICGHIHEARGQDVIGGSRIVNCGALKDGYYAVIDLDGSTITILNSRLQ